MGDKENVEGLGNRIMSTVDMTKKIRKTSPKKIYESRVARECFNGVPVYRDSELGFDHELRNLVQPQRIDNDVDTDEEQVESGVRRLTEFLYEAVEERANIPMDEEYDI